MGLCAVSASLYLNLIRTKAVFASNKPAVYVVTFMWIATVGCLFATPSALTASRFGKTQKCVPDRVKTYNSAGVIAGAVNDTLTFLAVTHQLLVFYFPSHAWRSRIRTFFTGAGMGRVSKTMLQTGQLYYMYAASVLVTAIRLTRLTAQR